MKLCIELMPFDFTQHAFLINEKNEIVDTVHFKLNELYDMLSKETNEKELEEIVILGNKNYNEGIIKKYTKNNMFAINNANNVFAVNNINNVPITYKEAERR